MRIISAIFVASSIATSGLAAGPSRPAPDEIKRAPAPPWAKPTDLLAVPDNVGGALFFRRQDVLVHLDDKGQLEYTGYRIKILQPAALAIGNLSIGWNPQSGSPTVHTIKVYRDGQTIDLLPTADFQILRREDQLEAAQLNGLLTAVFRVPDLRVGDELEVALTTPASDPTLGKQAAGILLLGASPAPGRYHLGVSWEEAQKPYLKLTPFMTAAAVTGEDSVDLRFDNPTVETPIKDAPARYQWQRVLQFSTFADWPAISRQFAPLYLKAAQLGNDSPLKQEAVRIATAHTNALDRASAALKLVQQNVRYIYVGLNGGNLTPASADQTWQRRYGDCKAKTALLLSLLAELGIRAEPVLVNSSGNDDGLDQRLPSPQLFDHVLVRAYIDGKPYWLDGTLPPVVPPAEAPIYPLQWVLPVDAQGMTIERIAWKPATLPDEINLHEIDARAGFDKPARITTTAIVRGIKGLQQQVQFSAVPADQLLNAFRQQAVGGIWQSIDDVQWRYDEKTSASILKITGMGTIDWENGDDGAKSLPLPGGGFSPPEKRIRAADQDQTLPYAITPEFGCHVTTVRLPTTTQPKQWSSKPGFDTHIFGRNYYRAFELRDGAIRMVRASRVEAQEIDAATASKDNARIGAFDNSMGYIFFSPTDRQTSFGSGQHVPTTDEIDWTASDVPCLAPPKTK